MPPTIDGAVICLGDMPLVDAALLDRLIAAFAPDRGALVAAPVSDGRRGNPVLWSRRLFSELLTLEGDTGARQLIDRHAELVAEVPVDGSGAFLDIDTPEALDAARRGLNLLVPFHFKSKLRLVAAEILPRWLGRGSWSPRFCARASARFLCPLPFSQ